MAGVTHQSGFYRRLIQKQKWAFALATLEALLKRPAIAPRLVRALRRPEEAQSASAGACLMSIAVHPQSEGKGMGSQLVEAFCEELSQHGASSICLMTDRDNNDRINRFYQRLGFQLSNTFITPEGRAMNEYLMVLAKKTKNA